MFYDEEQEKAKKKAEKKAERKLKKEAGLKESDKKIMSEQDKRELFLKGQRIAVSLVMIIVGIYIFMVNEPSENLCLALSIVLILFGIYSIFIYFKRDIGESFYQHNLLYGLICFMFAYIVYANKEELAIFVPIIVGIVILINGFSKLQHSIDMKRVDVRMKRIGESWLVVLIFSLILMVIGLVLLLVKSFSISTTLKLGSIGLIIAGVTEIVTLIVFDKKLKDFREATKRPLADSTQIAVVGHSFSEDACKYDDSQVVDLVKSSNETGEEIIEDVTASSEIVS